MLVKSPPTDYRDCKYEEEAGMPEAPLNRDSSALLNFAIDSYGERDVNESIVLLQTPARIEIPCRGSDDLIVRPIPAVCLLRRRRPRHRPFPPHRCA